MKNPIQLQALALGLGFTISIFGLSYTPCPSFAAERSANEANRADKTYSSYILGAGVTIQVEVFQIPEISGTFSIGPDGTIYLPRLRRLLVEGLTVDELRVFLTNQYKEFVRDPQLYITPVGFRGVRVYVGVEFSRPGYYTLSYVMQ